MHIKNNFYFKVLIASLLFVGVANAYGFNSSFKRRRDIQRILDMGNIQTGLYKYKQDFGKYPLSGPTGKIVGCRGEKTDIPRDSQGNALPYTTKKPNYLNLVECDWGKALQDPGDINYPSYLNPIPKDPYSHKGVSFLYISDGENYQILGVLELKHEGQDYNKQLEDRKLKCGKRVCNFGRSAGIPLTDNIY